MNRKRAFRALGVKVTSKVIITCMMGKTNDFILLKTPGEPLLVYSNSLVYLSEPHLLKIKTIKAHF